MKAIFITPEERNFGFEPVMWLRSQEMIQALGSLGVDVRPISLPEFQQRCRTDSGGLDEFNADFITAPNFNYFLVAASQDGRLPRTLDRPVVALWDDPLGALANSLRQPGRPRFRRLVTRGLGRLGRFDRTGVMRTLSSYTEDLATGRIKAFASTMQHPLLKHFSWDRGHIEAVESLGLLPAHRVQWYPIATYRPFLETGLRAKQIPPTRDVAFCGNVYLDLLTGSEMWKDPVLRDLTTRICQRKLTDLARPVWAVLLEEIETLPKSTRRAYGLFVDSAKFWDYYLFAVWHAANTLVRVGLLSGIRREVELFGLFADPKSVEAVRDYPNLKYRGSVPHFSALPDVYASTRINVCPSNGLIARGIPSKFVDCVASGGFALTDPKDDIREFFGPVAERIFFRNIEELNERIDYYLAHPAERAEIVDVLSDCIRQHCTLEALFKKVLAR